MLSKFTASRILLSGLILSVCSTTNAQLANGSVSAADFFNSGSSSTNTAKALRTDDEKFLDVDEAFALTIDSSDKGIVLEWHIAPNYYLYKRQFKIEQPTAADISHKAQYSRSLQKKDGYFGLVEVYYHNATAILPVHAFEAASDNTITVSYQGCAETGLCYPVQTRSLTLPNL